jgi:hypothetical protein
VAIVPAVPVNAALADPPGTVTVAGTLSTARLLASVTAAPPVPAALDNVTVQLVVPALLILPGMHDMELSDGRATNATEADCDPLPYVAVTCAVWSVVTVPAVPVKVALADPPGTVTVAGTVRTALPLASVTAAPPVPAALDSTTVHVAVPPLLMLLGMHDIELMLAGETSRSDVDWELLPYVAVTCTAWSVTMDPAVPVNVAAVAPGWTVTVAGTVRIELLLASATLTPPAPTA